MMATLVIAASGALFALGLGFSGMTDANTVLGFLNLAGPWDPSLALVMVGAIGVHLPLYRHIAGRPSPLFTTRFHLPTRRDVDGRLLGGAALFGAGWGLGGFCPGPGLVGAMSLGPEALTFTAAMFGGMALVHWLDHPRSVAAAEEVVPC